MTAGAPQNPVTVNDKHSALNLTHVAEIVPVRSTEDICTAVEEAARTGRGVAICGGRHAMGGQQFSGNDILIDTAEFNSVVSLDAERGLIEVDSGIQWQELHEWLLANQAGVEKVWTFRQKQTGANQLSIGGCLAANIHGRGLTLPPFVSDVESFTLVDSQGELKRCSREENADLFALAIGGYGLFGVIGNVTLRLTERYKVRRVVEIGRIDDLQESFDRRIAEGFQYGDFQFEIDPAADTFLQRGVFSCYQPVDSDAAIPEDQRILTPDDWRRLLMLAHTDKSAAFDHYAEHYLATSGQVYWSDGHQFATYIDDYHLAVDEVLGHQGSEVITEIFVPRSRLTEYMAAAAEYVRSNNIELIYGTIRLVQRDDETFLAWARRDYACIIFNLHVRHDATGREDAGTAFRGLIDLAITHNGSFYLTYHRHATREQIEVCHPKFNEFLTLKRAHDPQERFTSDWYRHHKDLFETTKAW